MGSNCCLCFDHDDGVDGDEQTFLNPQLAHLRNRNNSITL